MRWNIKRTKLLLALLPIISILFYVFTANDNLYADQTFIAFDIYQQITDTMKPIEGKDTPEYYTAAENFAIAADVYLNTEQASVTTNGTVTAMGFYKQTVLNFRAKSGGEIFSESISLSSLASVAEQRYFRDGAILYRPGITASNSVKGWSEDITELSASVYRRRYGVVPREITKYSVTDESIVSSSFVSKNGDGTYTYKLVLDPDEAQKYARYEMMTYANVDAFPEFFSCEIVFTIDSQWRMQRLVAYDDYKIALLNGTRCNSVMTDTFEYQNVTMPERSQIFRDYEITGSYGGINKVKGPSEYLSQAFGDYISGEKTLYLTADVDLVTERLSLAAAIDIAGGDYRFTLGDDIFGVYKDNCVYLGLGDNRYKLSVNDAMALIGGIDLGLGDELPGSADEMLEILFKNCEIVETDDQIHVVMPFKLAKFDVNVDMGLRKCGDDQVTADTIRAEIYYGILPITVDVKIVDTVSVPQFDQNEYVDLMPAIDAVQNTLALPAYDIKGSLTADIFKDTPIDYDLHIVKTEGGADIEGTLTVSDVDISVWLVGNKTVYLRSGNIGVKADIDDLPALIAAVSALLPEGAMPEIDTDELLPTVLPTLDLDGILSLLTNIEYDGRTVKLTVAPTNGNAWSMEITHGDVLSALKLDGLEIMGIGIRTEATLTEAQVTEVTPRGEFTDAKALEKFIPVVKEYMDAERYTLKNLDASVSVKGVELNVTGSAVFDRTTLETAATLYTGGAEIDLVCRDGTVYLSVGKLKVKGNIDDFGLSDSSTDAEKLVGTIGIALDSTSIPELLNSVILSCENDALTVALGQDIKLSLTLSGSFRMTCPFATISGDINADDGAVIPVTDQNEYVNVKPMIDAVQNTLALPAYTLKGSLTVDALKDTPIGYDLHIVKTEGGADIEGTLTVSDVDISVWLVGNKTVYLRSGNIGVKADIDDLPALIAAITALLPEGTMPEIDTDRLLPTVLPTLDLDGILSLLTNIEYDGRTVKLTVAPANGNAWSMEITHGDVLSALKLGGLEVMGIGIRTEATLTGAQVTEVTPVGEFTDANELAAYAPVVKDLLYSQNYLVELPTIVATIKDTEIILGGEFIIGRAPFAFSGTLKYGDIDIDLRYASNNIYVTVGEFTAECTVAELCEILYELGLPMPESYAEFVTMLADWHINIPDELSVSAWLGIVNLTAENGELTLALDLGESYLGFTLSAGNALYADAVFTHPVFSASAAGIKVTGCEATPAAPPAGKHFQLKNIIPMISPVRNLVKSKTFRVHATLDLSKDKLSEQATVVCDISLVNGLKLMGSVRLSEQAIDFVYDDGTVYLTVGNVRVQAALDKLGDLIESLTPLLSDAEVLVRHISHLLEPGQVATAVDVINTLDKLLGSVGGIGESDFSEIAAKLTFILPELDLHGITTLLSNVEVTDGTLLIPITAADGNQYSVSVKVSDGELNATVDRMTVYGYGIDATVKLESGVEFDYATATVDPDLYFALSDLEGLFPVLGELMRGEYFSLDITDSDIQTSVISAKVTGRVEIALDPLIAQAELTLRDLHKVNFVYYHDTGRIYLSLNDIYLTATVDDISAFVAELRGLISDSDADTLADVIIQAAEITSIIQNALGGMTVKDIVGLIDGLSYRDGKLTVSAHYDDLSLTAEITTTDGALGIAVTNFNYGDVVYDSHLTASLSVTEGLTSYERNYDDYVELADIQSFIGPVIDSFSSRYYHLGFSGRVEDEHNKVTTIDDGELKVQFTQGFANIYLRINLAGKTGDQKVELYLIDDTVYADEDAKFDKEQLSAYVNYNGFYAKVDYVAIVGIINSACDILGVRIPLLEQFLGEYDHIDTDVFETMDIVGLDDIRNTVNSLFNTATDVTTAAGSDSGILMGLLGMVSDDMIDKVLSGVSIKPDGDKLRIGISNGIFSLLNGDEYAYVSIAQKDELLDYIDISNLKVNGDTVQFTANFTYEEFASIVAPEGATDFSSIHTLLRSLIKTADLREFHITGTLSLNVLGMIKPNIGIDAKVKILDDGRTVAAIKLDVPYVSMIFSAALTRTESYIYYVNNRLYFIVDIWDSGALTEGSYKQNTEMKSATVEEFLSDPMEYLFFLLRMNDTIKSPIVNAISGGSSGSPSKNINDIIKSYTYSDNTFALTLGLKALTGNSDLGDLNLSITQRDGYISGLALDTKFVSIVSMALKNTVLANLTTDEDGKVNGCSSVGEVRFGNNNSINAHNFSRNIDNLEDDLALLFPIEAAETFGDKAANKAAKADKRIEEVKQAMRQVTDCASALEKADDDHKALSDKLAAAVKDSFGYDRLVAQTEYAKIAAERAQSDYDKALKNRVTAAYKACTAAADAYTYAAKAAGAASNAMNHTLDTSTAQAASNASTAALDALLASRNAISIAIQAATQAGEDGEAALQRLNSLREEISATEKDTAYEIANAATRASNYALPYLTSANDSLRASIQTADGLTLANTAKSLLATMTAMTSASNAATKAAEISENADVIAAALSTAEAVGDLTESAANNIVAASVKAATSLKEEAEDAATAAVNGSAPADISANVKTALDRLSAAESAANTANKAAKMIASTAQDTVNMINAAKAALGDKLTVAATTAAKAYGEELSTFDGTSLSDLATAKERLSGMMTALGSYAQKAYELSPTASNKQLLTGAYKDATINIGKLMSRSYATVSDLTASAESTMNSAITAANKAAKGTTLNNDRKGVRDAANGMTAAANNYTVIAQFVNALSDGFTTAYTYDDKSFTDEQKASLAQTVTTACQTFGTVRTTLNSSCGTALTSGEKLSTYANDKLNGGVTSGTKAEKEAAQNAAIEMTVALNVADGAISDMQAAINALLALKF